MKALFKPYVGITAKPESWSDSYKSLKNDEIIINSFYQLKNMQLDAGLRFHRNFGVEVFVGRMNYGLTKDNASMKFDSIYFGSDVKLYLQLPFTDFLEYIGTNLELYIGGGFAYLNTSLSGPDYTMKTNNIAPKYSGGFQLRLFGTTSVRAGVDFYHLDVAPNKIGIGNVISLTIGVHYYFL